ncbi:MAG: restriction endonuclease subunit S, partial [Bacteroidales bacterium]|nr:restriction endonuclease subunit S [Bacteroidales bacterium]
MPRLGTEDGKKALFPLPPLSEQKRIVAKLEEILPLVEEYGKAQEELDTLNNEIPEKLKKAILQEAIQGKLVPQIASEGNSKDLLHKIEAERKKSNPKFKPLPPVTDEEKPFEIPESWCWCRLGNVFDITMGQSPKGESVGKNIKGMEFHQGKIFFTNKWIAKSNQQTSEITKIAEPNSILLCMRAPVGKVNLTERKICIGRGLCSIVPLGGINVEWAYYLFETLENDFVKKSTGSTFKAITGDIVKDEIIPLPPLSEQKRIVAKLEELLGEVEKLKR